MQCFPSLKAATFWMRLPYGLLALRFNPADHLEGVLMQSPHVASKRIASKASLSGVAFVAAALAAAQPTPNKSQPNASQLRRKVEANYTPAGTNSTSTTHYIESTAPTSRNK